MADDVTSAERAEWAAIALEAYGDAAPTPLFPVPSPSALAHLGTIAATAYAEATRHNPADRDVNDTLSANLVIGDLIADLYHLADEQQIAADQLTEAAEELRARRYPVQPTALCAVAAAGAERLAAMLAALMESAEAFGCDVPEMVADAHAFYEDCMAEEALSR
ncbi:hypothetical protein OG594_46715 [Streptomyces sp. NBC_01214]|uniref:hypothetical protein n=1 Tax=Streptomyces sp. NBC_01214 TaxID=2903777 RepID=UPI0022520907|nr:hypothetical protein [Streptomyces sp. NBC_01214]MCX4808949.1 hypothetical protein [Streptomyces sp. NBC_01214]